MDLLGKNTRVGCHFLFQGIFPTQGSIPSLLQVSCFAGSFFTTEPPEFFFASDLDVPWFWAAPTSSSPPTGSAPLVPRFSPLVLTWCSFPHVPPAQEELLTSWWSPWTWPVPPLNPLARFSCRKLVSIRFYMLLQAAQLLSFKGSLYATLGVGAGSDSWP